MSLHALHLCTAHPCVSVHCHPALDIKWHICDHCQAYLVRVREDLWAMAGRLVNSRPICSICGKFHLDSQCNQPGAPQRAPQGGGAQGGQRGGGRFQPPRWREQRGGPPRQSFYNNPHGFKGRRPSTPRRYAHLHTCAHTPCTHACTHHARICARPHTHPYTYEGPHRLPANLVRIRFPAGQHQPWHGPPPFGMPGPYMHDSGFASLPPPQPQQYPALPAPPPPSGPPSGASGRR
jgi:hypothetical protein